MNFLESVNVLVCKFRAPSFHVLSASLGKQNYNIIKFLLLSEECSASGGYDLYTGRCLTLSSPLVMYPEAQDQCAAQGGHLVYYKSLTEDERPLADLITHAGKYDIMASLVT